jgi:hypothetical protein
MSQPITCAVCGKVIDANASRFVDKANGVTIHVHTACKQNG